MFRKKNIKRNILKRNQEAWKIFMIIKLKMCLVLCLRKQDGKLSWVKDQWGKQYCPRPSLYFNSLILLYSFKKKLHQEKICDFIITIKQKTFKRRGRSDEICTAFLFGIFNSTRHVMISTRSYRALKYQFNNRK